MTTDELVNWYSRDPEAASKWAARREIRALLANFAAPVIALAIAVLTLIIVAG